MPELDDEPDELRCRVDEESERRRRLEFMAAAWALRKQQLIFDDKLRKRIRVHPLTPDEEGGVATELWLDGWFL